MNIAIVVNKIEPYFELINLAEEKYILDIDAGTDYIKITFLNTNSTIVLNKFDSNTIYTPDIERKPYGDIRFIYDFIYFDDISPDFRDNNIMFKVIIAGGRDFNDYNLLKFKCDFYLSKINEEIEIVCGGAKGADSLGERYAKEKGLSIRNF